MGQRCRCYWAAGRPLCGRVASGFRSRGAVLCRWMPLESDASDPRVWKASVMGTRENTKSRSQPKQLQESCVPLYFLASSRPLGPSRRPRSCGHRSLSRMRPTPRVLCQSPMKRSPSRGAQSCRARCAALPRCRCPRNASPVALKLHVTHAFGTLRRQKSTPAETHQH